MSTTTTYYVYDGQDLTQQKASEIVACGGSVFVQRGRFRGRVQNYSVNLSRADHDKVNVSLPSYGAMDPAEALDFAEAASAAATLGKLAQRPSAYPFRDVPGWVRTMLSDTDWAEDALIYAVADRYQRGDVDRTAAWQYGVKLAEAGKCT